MLVNFNQILNGILTLKESGEIGDDIHANALITASFINLNLPGIRRTPNYAPVVEVEMILDTIRSLPSENNITPYLVSLLADLVENFHQKNIQLTQDTLVKITEILSHLPKNSFELIDLTQSESTISLLLPPGLLPSNTLAKQKRSFEEVSSLIDASFSEQLEEVSSLIDDSFSEEIDQIDALLEAQKETKAAIHELMLKNTAINSEALQAFLLSVIDFIPQELVKDLILLKSEQYENKELFVTDFLSAYQNMYNQLCRHLWDRLTFLDEMSVLLPALGQLISADRFLHLLENFELKDPCRGETDSAYATYFVTYCLIQGKEISNDPFLQQALLEAIAPRKPLLQALHLLGKSNKADEIFFSLKLPGVPSRLEQFLAEKTLTVPFEKLLAHLKKINNTAGTYQQRNITLLFIKYERPITLFIELGGKIALENMESLVASTLLPLEKMLEACPDLDPSLIGPLHEYCNKQIKTNKAFETFKLCLMTIKLFDLNSKSVDFMEMANNKSPLDFLNEMLKYILAAIFPDLPLELNETNIDALLKRFPVKNLVKLIYASQKMKDDIYRKIYLELLKIDLFGGEPDRLLHDVQQASPLGQDLAHHNQKIQNSLRACGIDPDEALNYQKTYGFILLPPDTPVEQLSIDNRYLVLWRDLNSLNNEIAKLDISRLDINIQVKIQKIASNISQLRSKIERQLTQGIAEKDAAKNILANSDFLNTIVGNNIVKNCTVLKENKAPLPNSFFEFSDHVCDRLHSLTQQSSRESLPQSFPVQPMYIEVVQWPKDRIDTFFLGDEVGCCLATNGNQFQAIVHRRMDDAMLFHVAIDKMTDKPIALMWLYLAETADNHIVLMANFFEVKAKFGQDEYKRKVLLNALLQFTKQYLEDNPGISGFYMNTLKYGWNLHDLDCYAIKPLLLKDKLGGPYIPGEELRNIDLSDPTIRSQIKLVSQRMYFLASLTESQFHEFSPTVLQAMMQENIVPISKLIHEAVFEITKLKVTFDILLQRLIQRHGIELEPFYAKPLNTNQQFLNIVYKEYEDANIFHETGGNVRSPVELLKCEYAFFKRITTFLEEKAAEKNDKLGTAPEV